jgi:hypothetical protein
MKKNINNNSTDWINDRELKKILEIDDFKVSELVLNFDLIAYAIDGNIRHFYDGVLREFSLEIGSLKFKRKDIDEFNKNYPDLGDSEQGRPEPYRWRLENEIKNIMYLEQNRKQQALPPSSHLQKEKRRIKDEIRDSEKIYKNKLSQNQKGKNKYEYHFKKEGDIWKVRYKNEQSYLRDLGRIRYIVHLLDNPGEKFTPNRLASIVKGNELSANPNYRKLSEKQLQKEGLTKTETPNGLLEEDYQELKKKIRTLWERCTTSPDEEKAREEWDHCKDIMASQYGIFVDDSGDDLKFRKKERLIKDKEKARSNVSKQISTAIKKLEENMPSLAEHLRVHISTGASCTYNPDTDNKIDWNIRW